MEQGLEEMHILEPGKARQNLVKKGPKRPIQLSAVAEQSTDTYNIWEPSHKLHLTCILMFATL